MTGTEQVLIEDWCQQYPSHSVGDLAFGADGALYVSGGDGASFDFADYGQDGQPLNPCGDPPGGVGAALTPPTAQGGALRSLDLTTPSTPTNPDPVGLDGTILRVDPATGAGLPDNPLASSSDPNARRIVAHGLRNPFRFTMRPGTNEVWLGDVGWGSTGGDQPASPSRATARSTTSAGPATRATGRQAGYDGANLNLCDDLYAARADVHAARTSTRTTAATRSSPGSPRAASPAAARSPGWTSTSRDLPRQLRLARCSSPTTRATASG